METKSKAETYVGFVIRTGNYRIGGNAVQTLKRAYLMIVCNTASENSKEQAEKIAKKFKCPLLECREKTLEQLTHKENAKIMAIADKALSAAILDNSEKDFVQRI